MQESNYYPPKSSLSRPKAQLIELMQGLNFGRIEGLAVHGGEPVLDPLPPRVRDVKFCAENGPRPEINKQDYSLKAQIRELFEQIQAMGNGIIRCLEIKHGLPFKMSIEEGTVHVSGSTPGSNQ